jgi:hypothetical protein
VKERTKGETIRERKGIEKETRQKSKGGKKL